MKKLLVIVDMQNDFVTGCLGTKEAANIASDVKKYAEEFDGDIIFTRDTHDDNYLNTQEGRKLPVVHCIKGSEGHQIINELINISNKPNVKVIDKNTFGSISLANIIKESDYEAIYMCGVCTGICVISNALLIKAFSPDLPIYVLESLCACVTTESHENALNAMRTCQIDII